MHSIRITNNKMTYYTSGLLGYEGTEYIVRYMMKKYRGRVIMGYKMIGKRKVSFKVEFYELPLDLRQMHPFLDLKPNN